MNNISLNNLTNIYLDYLAKINKNKNKINNSYKNINSVSKKKIVYASKEKDNDIILKNNKYLEKNREKKIENIIIIKKEYTKIKIIIKKVFV